MRLIGSRCRRHLACALWAGCVGGIAACSVYEENPAGPAGGAAGAGSRASTTGAGGDPTSTSSTSVTTDTTASTAGPGAGGSSGESVTVGTAGSGGDPGNGGAAGEAGNGGSAAGMSGSGITDASTNDARDVASTQEADATPPLPPQTLPPHGVVNLTPAAAPFTSACNADEVVIGFSIRAGAWTDAIASICAKLSGATLGAIRVLPLNGKQDGGNPQQMLCPTNFVAAGIVGNYGHSTRFNVDQMTGLGVVCREIANSANLQVVAVTQAQLDTEGGTITFREDCTVTRWLTSLSGTLDNNTVSGQSVVRLGGECNSK